MSCMIITVYFLSIKILFRLHCETNGSLKNITSMLVICCNPMKYVANLSKGCSVLPLHPCGFELRIPAFVWRFAP